MAVAEKHSGHVQIGLEQGDAIAPKVPGELMAHYYVKFKTMVGLITAPTHASLPDLIMLLGAPCTLSSCQMVLLRLLVHMLLRGVGAAMQPRARSLPTSCCAAARRRR